MGKINVEILDTKTIEHRSWYLCKGNLLDYLDNLKINFYDFAIQRKIVKNQYLDIIYKTIASGDPIPLITLTYQVKNIAEQSKNKGTIDLALAEILDGLQRTFRLWTYMILAERFENEKAFNLREFAKKLKQENVLFFETGVLSTSLIKDLIETNEINRIKKSFANYDIYFVVWTGLNENEIIQKMLVLNAGQKAVSKTHQFELLFLHFYEEISKADNKIKLFREKDFEANNIKRGKRNVGDFMFSSIIIALQSLIEKKPQRVTTEVLINMEGEEDISAKTYELVFNKEFLKIYLDNLYELDTVIAQKEQEKGKEWFVKDTSLSGVFAALGKYIEFDQAWDKGKLISSTKKGFEDLTKAILDNGLFLDDFTQQYNILSSRIGNIGNFIRRVITDYVYSLLKDKQTTWQSVFESIKS
jgi:hypothetical protein